MRLVNGWPVKSVPSRLWRESKSGQTSMKNQLRHWGMTRIGLEIDAQSQARFEYGRLLNDWKEVPLNDWKEVPSNVEDALEFALNTPQEPGRK